MKNVLKLMLTVIALFVESTLQQQQQQQPQQQQQQMQPQMSGGLNQNIYQFIKSTQILSRVSG